MTLNGVMIGQRFVLFDKVGVWLKIDGNKAKCLYGPEVDKTVEIGTGSFVYAIYDHPRYRPAARSREQEQTKEEVVAIPSTSASVPVWSTETITTSITGVKLVVMDESDRHVIFDVENATATCIASVVASDGLRWQGLEYPVEGVVWDQLENMICVYVGEGRKL